MTDTPPEVAALATHYVSTYCMHAAELTDTEGAEALHRACRLSCKTCGEACRCSCGHPWAELEER
jgi:hypothetical protein